MTKEIALFGVRRLVARFVDHCLLFLIAGGIHGLLPSPHVDYRELGFLIVLAYCPLEVFFTYMFGCGPGKFLLSLRVVSRDGRSPSLLACSKRAICVLLFGEGLALAPFSTIAFTSTIFIYLYFESTVWDGVAATSVVRFN